MDGPRRLSLRPDEWELLGALLAPVVADRQPVRLRFLGADADEGVDRLHARLGSRAEPPSAAGADLVIDALGSDSASRLLEELARAKPGAVVVRLGAAGSHAGALERARTFGSAECTRLCAADVLARTGDPSLTRLSGSPDLEAIVVRKRPEGGAFDRLPDDLATDRFSLDAYADVLARSLDAGYRVIGVPGAIAGALDADRRYLLLRHDIDVVPRLATAMARLEAVLGVRSTYFVMVSSPFYNVLEEEHRRAIRAIADRGHEIGLHYDEHDDIEGGVEILSRIAGAKVRCIAQHTPAISPRRGSLADDLLDAYDPRITTTLGFAYVSDSGMKWRRESLATLVDEGCPRIYALCHPENWFSDGRDMVALLRELEGEHTDRVRRRYDAIVAAHVDYLRARKTTDRA